MCLSPVHVCYIHVRSDRTGLETRGEIKSQPNQRTSPPLAISQKTEDIRQAYHTQLKLPQAILLILYTILGGPRLLRKSIIVKTC